MRFLPLLLLTFVICGCGRAKSHTETFLHLINKSDRIIAGSADLSMGSVEDECDSDSAHVTENFSPGADRQISTSLRCLHDPRQTVKFTINPKNDDLPNIWIARLDFSSQGLAIPKDAQLGNELTLEIDGKAQKMKIAKASLNAPAIDRSKSPIKLPKKEDWQLKNDELVMDAANDTTSISLNLTHLVKTVKIAFAQANIKCKDADISLDPNDCLSKLEKRDGFFWLSASISQAGQNFFEYSANHALTVTCDNNECRIDGL